MRTFCIVVVFFAGTSKLNAFQGTSGGMATGASKPDSLLVLKLGEGWGPPFEEILPLLLPDGRILVTAVDLIYMVGENGKVIWKYSPEGAPLNAQPVFRFDKNEIAFVGMDLTFERLNADTGQLIWHASAMGNGATYKDVRPFGDGYLVLVGMGGYRDRDAPDLPDKLEYWPVGIPDSAGWDVDFPIGANLIVSGKKIYAMQREKDSITLQEVTPPSGPSN